PDCVAGDDKVGSPAERTVEVKAVQDNGDRARGRRRVIGGGAGVDGQGAARGHRSGEGDGVAVAGDAGAGGSVGAGDGGGAEEQHPVGGDLPGDGPAAAEGQPCARVAQQAARTGAGDAVATYV